MMGEEENRRAPDVEEALLTRRRTARQPSPTQPRRAEERRKDSSNGGEGETVTRAEERTVAAAAVDVDGSDGGSGGGGGGGGGGASTVARELSECEGAERWLSGLLGGELAVVLVDGRLYRGRCECIDRHHLILYDARQLIRRQRRRGGAKAEEKEEGGEGEGGAVEEQPRLTAHPTLSLRVGSVLIAFVHITALHALARADQVAIDTGEEGEGPTPSALLTIAPMRGDQA